MDADLILFLALTAFAIAIAGATALVIFWPLTLVHIRDRHPQITAHLGHGAFLKPKALWWLLRGGYRAAGDRSLSGLAELSLVSPRLSLLPASNRLATAFDLVLTCGSTQSRNMSPTTLR